MNLKEAIQELLESDQYAEAEFTVPADEQAVITSTYADTLSLLQDSTKYTSQDREVFKTVLDYYSDIVLGEISEYQQKKVKLTDSLSRINDKLASYKTLEDNRQKVFRFLDLSKISSDLFLVDMRDSLIGLEEEDYDSLSDLYYKKEQLEDLKINYDVEINRLGKLSENIKNLKVLLNQL